MIRLLAQMDLPELDDSGPGGVEELLGLFFVLFAIGFIVGALGHAAGSKTLQIAGIALVFVSTAVFFIGLGGQF